MATSCRGPRPTSARCSRRSPFALAILRPPVGDAAGLRAALLAADAIYFPDPKQATAGIHFAGVLERLGIAADVASRLKTFPNGATAMRELAAATTDRPIGCTQVTEIISTRPASSSWHHCRKVSSWRRSTRPAFARVPTRRNMRASWRHCWRATPLPRRASKPASPDAYPSSRPQWSRAGRERAEPGSAARSACAVGPG